MPSDLRELRDNRQFILRAAQLDAHLLPYSVDIDSEPVTFFFVSSQLCLVSSEFFLEGLDCPVRLVQLLVFRSQ